MASPVLHIKDSYYFEVPKALWRSNRKTISAFPDLWVRLDPEFQEFEAHLLVKELQKRVDDDAQGEVAHLEEHCLAIADLWDVDTCLG